MGERNHGAFLLFVLSACLACLSWLIMMVLYLRNVPAGATLSQLRRGTVVLQPGAEADPSGSEGANTAPSDAASALTASTGWFAHARKSPIWFVLGLQPVWMLAFGVVVLLHQASIIAHGITSNELINSKRYSYLLDPATRKFRNPFSSGSGLRNCFSFWFISWPVPSAAELREAVRDYFEWMGFSGEVRETGALRNHASQGATFLFHGGDHSGTTTPDADASTFGGKGVGGFGASRGDDGAFAPGGSPIVIDDGAGGTGGSSTDGASPAAGISNNTVAVLGLHGDIRLRNPIVVASGDHNVDGGGGSGGSGGGGEPFLLPVNAPGAVVGAGLSTGWTTRTVSSTRRLFSSISAPIGHAWRELGVAMRAVPEGGE